MIEYEHRADHWRWTSRFGLAVLVATVLLILVAPLIAGQFDWVFVMRLPVAFYLSAQGLIIIAIAVVFWYSTRQERTDRRFGATED